MPCEDDKQFHHIEDKKPKPRGRPPKPKEPILLKEPKILKTSDRILYDKNYNKNYYLEKRQKLIQVCDVCGGKYDKYNKTKHDLTNRHVFLFNKINNLN